MKTKLRVHGFSTIVWGLALTGSLMAAEPPKTPPDLTQDRTVDRKLTCNLGSTGMRRWICARPANFRESQHGRTTMLNCVCSGLTALLRDDREVPDTWVATYPFEKLDRTVTFAGSMNSIDSQPMTICGHHATLRFDAMAHDVSTFELIPASHNQRTGLPKVYQRGRTPSQPNHMVVWLNCIRSRGAPKCSTDEAFIETATFLMSLVSQPEHHMVRWDAVREEIV